MSDENTKDGRGPRSPGYPSISLSIALERADRLKAYSPNRRPVPVDVALQQWNYKPKSGAGMQQLAALKKYGLLLDEGSLDTRSVRLSDLAWKILTDPRPDSDEKLAAIRSAAKSPKINSEILERWPHGLPDDVTVHHWLVQEKRFNEKAVRGFLAQLRETFEYAKLDSEPETDDNSENGNDVGTKIEVKTGDWVQWTSQGVARFEQSRKVLGLSEDGEYAFVEGSKTGVPVAELVLGTPAGTEKGGANPPPSPFASTTEKSAAEPGCKQDVFALDSGAVTVRWPESMTQADFEDIQGWLKILERKIGRSVKSDPPAE